MTSRLDLPEFLAAHPEIEVVEAFVCDVNGVARGKWLPPAKAAALAAKGLPMPRSIFALDIWGQDVADAGMAFGTGDPDGLCHPVPDTVAVMPWTLRPTAQVMLTMGDDAGGTFYADPRGVLAGLVARLARRGLTAVIATELEFYLLDGVSTQLDPMRPPATGGDRWSRLQGQVLSVDALHRHEAVFAEIAAACDAQGLPAEGAMRENGPGQYEINLLHVADPLVAADHAVQLKRIVKGIARRHGLAATFMAKPYGEHSGNGMHMHCSLLDADGRPSFCDAHGQPSPMLLQAVAGLVRAMPESMLLFAPHANSYRRFRTNSHAPTCADWNIDDRSAAVRVILGAPNAVRIEHRVAGADCNPYLAIAGLLAGILDGLERELQPPPPGGAAAGSVSVPLPREWGVAIEAFAGSALAADHLGLRFRDMLAACKRQDFDGFLSRVSDVELDAYREIA